MLGTGTSQGVPVIGCDCEVCHSTDMRNHRLRASIMIQVGGKNIVIDIGPDFRQQILRTGENKVDAILITHEHNDHVAGMDDVRPINFKHLMDMPMYAEQRVVDILKSRFSYAFAKNPYPGVPQIHLTPIHKSKPFTISNIEITPIEVLHYKLPVLGFRIKDFTYITDIKTISEEEKEKVKGTKTLIVSALRKEPHISHFTLEEALDFIKEIAPERAFLTHLSHRMGLHHKIEAALPDHVKIAYDGQEIVV